MPLALFVCSLGVELDFGAEAIDGRGHGPPVLTDESASAARPAALVRRHPQVAFATSSAVARRPPCINESYRLSSAPSAVDHGAVGGRGRTSGGS